MTNADPRGGRTPVVSIVVPTFDRRTSLARLLNAISAQTYPLSELEVVVVDDGSTDGTREFLEQGDYPYSLRVFSQKRGGPGAARNRGVAAATGRLVVFLDDDVVPDPDVIRTHVDAHERNANTVIVGPMLPPAKWRRPAWIRWEEENLVKVYDAMAAGVWPCTPRQFFTANASLLREHFARTGGFDASFRRAEDVELGYRLAQSGLRFVFEPRARAWHYARRTFASWRRTPYEYGRADVRMHRQKGHDSLGFIFEEYYRRRRMNRAFARVCVGRPAMLGMVTVAIRAFVRAADTIGARRPASAALSALYNLLYWQGVSDGIGGRDVVWRSVASHAPARRLRRASP